MEQGGESLQSVSREMSETYQNTNSSHRLILETLLESYGGTKVVQPLDRVVYNQAAAKTRAKTGVPPENRRPHIPSCLSISNSACALCWAQACRVYESL